MLLLYGFEDITEKHMKPTNYEIGNDIMHNICDKMSELEHEIEKDHPELAMALRKNRLMYGPVVNTLMEDSLCPTAKKVGKFRSRFQKLIDEARMKYEDDNRRKQNSNQLRDSQERN